MVWFRKKPQYITVPTVKKSRVPDGLWQQCEQCLNIIYTKDIENNYKVCPKCDHHFRLSSEERIQLTFDEDTFKEYDTDIAPTDPLNFEDSKKYKDRLKTYQKKSGLTDAVITGKAMVAGNPVHAAVMDFSFIGGSMGAVVGEKITRVLENAIEEKLPAVVICTSGGARMQEGILSLMQMAKTSAAVSRIHKAGLPYITILTHPTTAGVMASYASLGDVTIIEPNALIGFAGPRVIQQTINQVLPKGFQRSEFIMEHGFADIVCHRRDIKPTLVNLLDCFMFKFRKTAEKVPV